MSGQNAQQQPPPPPKFCVVCGRSEAGTRGWLWPLVHGRKVEVDVCSESCGNRWVSWPLERQAASIVGGDRAWDLAKVARRYDAAPSEAGRYDWQEERALIEAFCPPEEDAPGSRHPAARVLIHFRELGR